MDSGETEESCTRSGPRSHGEGAIFGAYPSPLWSLGNISQSYLLGGSRCAAFRCQHCSNLLLVNSHFLSTPIVRKEVDVSYNFNGLFVSLCLCCSLCFISTRRCASVCTRYDPMSVCLCLSVCHKSVFYRNWWAERAGFWRVGFFWPILHCVIRKFR